MHDNEYRHLIATIHRRHVPMLERRLGSAFPRACWSKVEDAIADAFTDAIQRPAPFVAAWQRGGEEALIYFIYQVGWRQLRGHFRKKASRCEIPGGELLLTQSEPRDRLTPYVIVAGHETAALASRLVEEAAARFGGGRRNALRAALYVRLDGGTDAEVARTHNVPREYVNRAKRWIGSRLRNELRQAL